MDNGRAAESPESDEKSTRRGEKSSGREGVGGGGGLRQHGLFEVCSQGVLQAPPTLPSIGPVPNPQIQHRGRLSRADRDTSAHFWAIQIHPDSWDNPELFDPDRFLNNDVDFKSRDCFHFIPFGFGRRECPGMTFGTVNVEYLIANLLYWFDWPVSPDNFDMDEIHGITVGKKVPIVLVPKLYSP